MTTSAQNIVTCSPGEFYSLYACGWEFVGDDGMEPIFKKMLSDATLGYPENVFRAFPGSSNHSKDTSLDEIWEGIAQLFADIVDAAEQVLPERFHPDARTATFQCNRQSKTFVHKGVESFRLDGYTVLKDKSAHGAFAGSAIESVILNENDPEWIGEWMADIGVSVLWSDGDDAAENEEQSIGVANQILYSDCRRVAHIAITIEDTTARIWYHTRSYSAVTHEFDINKRCTDFIQFVLFATYAKCHLGLDPGIARVVDASDSLQYQFSVPKNILSNKVVVYQTTGILAACSLSGGLYGKGRSVYTAKPADRLGDGLSIRSEAQEHVLRDTHLLPCDPRESEMQRELISAMNAIAGTEETERMKKFFVKIASDMPAKYNVQRRSPSFTWPKKIYRQRWMTVYAERCHDLYEVDDPVLFHRALAEVMIFLKFLFRVGRVHHDISPGNIMLYWDPLTLDWVVKVIDFEFTKRYEALEPWARRTGTRPYMAIEIEAGKHMFLPENAPDSLLAANHFNVNFCHDVESVLWIALHRAYGPDTPMVRLHNLIHMMGDAHRMVQARDIDEELGAGLPAAQVRHKRLAKENFDTDVYHRFEEVFRRISEYYEGKKGLLRIDRVDIDVVAGIKEGEVIVNVGELTMPRWRPPRPAAPGAKVDPAPEGQKAKAESEGDLLPEVKESPNVRKRRATEDTEDAIEAKRPRVSLPQSSAHDGPPEGAQAHREGSARDVLPGDEGFVEPVRDGQGEPGTRLI
uniref:Fungal-type protein kinase domain-containing protein n=1 Tax=Schizophyllum commune (strain H4-8 / FGSC 9210) TaxID=578458 RepID=D8QAK8_SCHCM